jgi:hypothetical protein
MPGSEAGARQVQEVSDDSIHRSRAVEDARGDADFLDVPAPFVYVRVEDNGGRR